MIYQHPLAYLLGMEAVALLHAFAGDYDRDFAEARLAEVRALLDSADQLGGGSEIRPIPVVEGYGAWAEAYDQPGNQLIDLEQPIVWEILDGLPRGIALDAACGTGRPAEYLARLGHTVIGVDSSPRMLAVAFAPARALRSPAARARKLVKSTGRGEHLVDRPRDRLTRA
jgi:SAM-dependent methyltransferase